MLLSWSGGYRVPFISHRKYLQSKWPMIVGTFSGICWFRPDCVSNWDKSSDTEVVLLVLRVMPRKTALTAEVTTYLLKLPDYCKLKEGILQTIYDYH